MFPITENISLWGDVVLLKGSYELREERTSYNKGFLENISLWEGVGGPERPIHTGRGSQLQ